MESDITSAVEHLDLKVLVERDDTYETYVARCLESGSVATGDTPEQATALIKETLELEILLAIKDGSLANLLRFPAPPDVHERWYMARTMSGVEEVPLYIPADPPKRSVKPEISIVNRVKQSVA